MENLDELQRLSDDEFKEEFIKVYKTLGRETQAEIKRYMDFTADNNNEDIKNRIDEVMKIKGLSYYDFGFQLGFTYEAMSGDKDYSDLTEYFIEMISTTYNVNKEWLKTGEGEMFINDREG